ncbi:Glutamine amidotransferases class-II family protein [Francisella sp. MA067296]|nr:Glutamine amidotransferases class-II family protein [Francisella sp. MA067296]
MSPFLIEDTYFTFLATCPKKPYHYNSLKISTIGNEPSLYYISYKDIIETLDLKKKNKLKSGFVVLSEPLVASDLYNYINNYTCIEIKQNEFRVEKL